MTKKISRHLISDQEVLLSLQELCQATQVEEHIIIEFVDNQLIEPQGNSPESWQFNALCLKRTRTAISFYHDLEVNISGIALALDLIDKIDSLEQQVTLLEKMLGDR